MPIANIWLFIFLAVTVSIDAMAQPGKHYYPGERWARMTPTEAGFHQAALEKTLSQARERLSTGVIILKDGKIVVEQYWPDPSLAGFPPRMAAAARNMLYGRTPQGYPLEDVASVQKSVTATLAAVAVNKGLIAFDDPVSRYLGPGWAKATPAQAGAITIRELMTMTSGLSESLHFEVPPNTRWQYNTGAYQNVLRVLEKASGKDANTLTRQWLAGAIGMKDTRWVVRTWAHQDPPMMGLVTTPRDLARFGLLVLNHGRWRDRQVVPAPLMAELTRQSQKLNPSYAMLFWLNNPDGHMAPRSTAIEQGKRVPAAPADMISALGALDRFVFILPSQRIVIVRTGLIDIGDLESETFARDWWKSLAKVF